jgi:hypothetical protein
MRMRATARCIAIMTLVMPLVFTGPANADFRVRDLKGVYTLYSDDNSQVSAMGVVEVDGLGNVTGGTVTTLFLPTIPPPPPPDGVASLVFTVVSGEYEINPDGTGIIEVVNRTEDFGDIPLNIAFVSTRVNDKGKVIMARITMLQPSVVSSVATDLDPSLITGFIERLPLKKLRTLPETEPAS